LRARREGGHIAVLFIDLAACTALLKARVAA
jgi:hypothetical protein